jgi:hypothetical protein
LGNVKSDVFLPLDGMAKMKRGIIGAAPKPLIAKLSRISDNQAATNEQRLAAGIATQALLALRDTIKRADRPKTFNWRIIQIHKLLTHET